MRGFIGKFSLGRYRQRPAFLLVIAFVMAIFAVAVPFSRTAYAADVTRSGDSFVYGGNTFAPVQQGEMPTGLPSDTSGYLYRNNPIKKAEFIFISGDTKTATTAEYVIYDMTPPSNFSKPSPPKTLSIAAIAPSSASSAINGAKSTCSGDITQGMGWILCPVVNFLASGMDHLYQMLTGFLEVRPVQTDQTSALYRMWAIIRDIANVCFVIAFLFIVYSQITSVGITNYGIKKLLPRLIIGAVLVNTSFLISSLAVDLSNFLGYSIHDLFTSIFSSLNTTDQYKDLNWSNIAANVLSGGAIGAGAVYGGYVLVEASVGGALILLIPTLVGVLLSVLVALLVISARQALITVLIIVSPLAFVAYLLPNTEKYFTKWRELFMTLLLVFPMFALIFGGAQIAGLAIIQNANSLNLVILGMAVQVAPIVVTPMLIKLSGSLVGKIAGIVNNPKAGIMDRTKNWAKERSAQHKSMVLAGVGRNSQMNRWTRAVDYNRRKRDGYKKAYDGVADVRFGGSVDGHNIQAITEETSNIKTRSENRFRASERGRRLWMDSQHLGVEKQEIENRHMRRPEGHALTARTGYAQIDKQRVENEFNNTGTGRQVRFDRESVETDKLVVDNIYNSSPLGHQSRHRREITESEKTDVDTQFSRTTMGQQVDRARRAAESRKKLAEGENSERFTESDEGKMYDLHIREQSEREASVKQTADRHYTEIRAGKVTDGFFGNYASDAALTPEGQALSDRLRETHLKTTLDAQAKRDADLLEQKNTAKEIESTAAHTVLGGLSARDYAAQSVAGPQGAASALAGAQTTLREQLTKSSNEYEELRNNYMPPIGDIKSFLRGSDASGNPVNNLDFKDEHGNVVLSVDANDSAAMNAMAKHITTVGIVDEVSEMLTLSGKGQRLYEYRETIADALARRGIAGRSIFEGGQMIELVRQGQVASDTDLLEYIQTQVDGGKVSAQDLSVMDAKAVKRFVRAVKHDRRTGANDAGAPINGLAQYDETLASLLKSAHVALTDDRIKTNVKEGARKELEVLNAVYEQLEKDADGNIDMSQASIADIQKLIPPKYSRP